MSETTDQACDADDCDRQALHLCSCHFRLLLLEQLMYVLDEAVGRYVHLVGPLEED